MNSEKQFEKYHPKFKQEAWIKSLLSGLSVGFAAAFVAAFVTWFLPSNGLLIILAALVVATLVSTVIFYGKKFRPTVMTDARRLDRLGLEERMITMVELQAEESCIAQCQRQDAQAALTNIDKSQIKMEIPSRISWTAAVAGVLCCAMTLISILSAMGLFIRGDELMEQIIPDEPDVYIAVTYIVDEGGYIEGETDQLILYGEDAEPVLAVADEGWAFIGWDDGNLNPYREEMGVVQEVTYTAQFAPLGEDGMADDSDAGDERSPDASEPGNKGEQEGDGDPSEDGDPGNEAGGKYDEWNHIIDGEIYYREFLESYRDRLIQQLQEQGDELTEEEKAIIESYINLV